MQRFRGGLVFKAHRICVSLNSRLESNNEEEKKWSHARIMHITRAHLSRHAPSSGAAKGARCQHTTESVKQDSNQLGPPRIVSRAGDRLRVGWPYGFLGTDPESYITDFTLVYEDKTPHL